MVRSSVLPSRSRGLSGYRHRAVRWRGVRRGYWSGRAASGGPAGWVRAHCNAPAQPPGGPHVTVLSLGHEFLEYFPKLLVKLGRLLQHWVVADLFDGDGIEVGILLVDLDGRRPEELIPAGGVDAAHRRSGFF